MLLVARSQFIDMRGVGTFADSGKFPFRAVTVKLTADQGRQAGIIVGEIELGQFVVARTVQNADIRGFNHAEVLLAAHAIVNIDDNEHFMNICGDLCQIC